VTSSAGGTCIPGVGPLTALTVKAGIDDPSRFRKSKTVGAHFGLTPKREQSGTSVDRDGHISRCGDSEVGTALYEASSAMLTRSGKWLTLKAWGVRVAAKRGHKRAVVAVGRKFAVIMHRMWRDGTEFRFSAAGQRPFDPATDEVIEASAALHRRPKSESNNGPTTEDRHEFRPGTDGNWWIDAEAESTISCRRRRLREGRERA
jgi:Transposase IS116/IS110/IS902 family